MDDGVRHGVVRVIGGLLLGTEVKPQMGFRVDVENRGLGKPVTVSVATTETHVIQRVTDNHYYRRLCHCVFSKTV